MPKPHPLNIAGPFYVEDGCCMFCGVWEQDVPDLLAWDGTEPGHCFVSRQPETEAEIGRMLKAMERNEVDCIRVRNCSASLKTKLVARGLDGQIDASEG